MRARLRVAVALALGFIAALSLLLHGASCGQDFDFHLQSWLAVRAAWHAGVWAPHWVAAANYGAGEPRFVFYPPLSWLLGALLSLVLPWAWVPWAFCAVCFAGAAWAMQRAAGRLSAPQAGAALAAAVYALSPYLLFTGYERGAYGELLAAVWIPPLLVSLTEARLPVVRIALLLAALWYTNAPAAVMGCYAVPVALLWRSGRALFTRWRGVILGPAERLGRLWLHGCAALVLSCALAADYLLPAWFEQRYVTIRRAIGPGMRVEDSFLFEHTGQAYHDQVLRTASWIAVATFAAGLLCLGLLFRQRNRRGEMRRAAPAPSRPAGFLTALLTCCVLLQLRPSEWAWQVLPQLNFLQFPWRLLLPASASVALLLALAAAPLKGRRRAAVALLCALLYAGALTDWAAVTRFQACDDEDVVSAQLLLPGHGGFEGTDEYAAKGSDNGEIQQGLPRVRLLAAPSADEGDDTTEANPAWKPEPAVPGSIMVTAWGPDRRGVRVHPAANAYAVLRLERFPAWQVLLNGKPCGPACISREDGLLTIAVPGGRWSTITARFSSRWDVWAGRVISLFGVVAALLAALLLSPPRSIMMSRK